MTSAVTMEERQTYISQATTAEATYQSALANLEQARINFKRTQVRSPVNGYVTNLSAQLGNYADVGSLQLSLVNSDSYWVDAYFEETALSRIHEGDAATIKLMGYTPLLRGRVQGLARGIDVPNAPPDASGLASVNPIFTFVRLAQRVPVRIHIDEVPEGVKLVAGMTATVQIEPYKAPPVSSLKPAPANVSQADVQPASFQTLTDASPQTAPSEVAKQAATTPAPPAQAANQPATQAAQPQPPHSRLRQASKMTVAIRDSRRRTVRVPPALAAGHSRGGSGRRRSQDAPTADRRLPAGRRRVAKSDGRMPSSEYLGQTYDLFGGQSTTPAPNTEVSRLAPQARPLEVAALCRRDRRSCPSWTAAVTIFAAFSKPGCA